MSQEDSTTFSYENKLFFHTLPIIGMYISILIFLPLALIMLGEAVLGKFVFDEEGISDIVFTLFGIVLIPMFSSMEVNMFPTINLGDDCLKIQVFNLRWIWIEIPWDNIIRIETIKKTYRGKQIWCIHTLSHLTFWHKLLKRRFKESDFNTIFFTEFLEEEAAAVRIIKTKIPPQ